MKVCEMCGAQNDDVFTKCAICGADLPSPNGEVGDDEKTILIDPSEAGVTPGLSLKTDANAGQSQPDGMGQPGFGGQPGGMGQPGFGGQPGGMGQPRFGGQPDGMPGQAPYGQPGGMPGQAPYGQPGGMPGQPPYGQPGIGAGQAPKTSKAKIIGILAGAAALVAIVLLLIFKFGVKSGGEKSPEDVAKQFIEAMDEKDADKMAKLCPPFLDPGKDDIEDMIDMYEGYDVKFTYEGVESKDEYTGDDLKDFQEEVSDYAEKDIKLQGACDVEFSFNIKMSYLGQDMDESQTYTLTCIKYRGGWYLYE